MRYLLFAFGIVLMIGCFAAHKTAGKTSAGDIKEIHFINEYILPNDMQFKNTTVGGLSGIDYDAKRDVYYMISDDPSSKGPTRYFTAKIPIREKGIDSVQIVDVTALLNPQRQPYADITKDRLHSADVEAMRYDPSRDELVWSSEGQRVIKDGTRELQDPAIVIMDRNGRYKDSFKLPANMHIQADEKGPRHNRVFEGLAFADNDSSVYISLEDAIYEDGNSAGTGDSTTWIRLLKFDRKTKKQVTQFTYQVDAVHYASVPAGASKINGVSDILYAGNDKFIVIERGYSTGRIASDIRVYLADIKNAEDISAVASLVSQPPQKPVTKKLLLDMNELGRFIDNIEGVTFGPLLPNGHRSLIFVADNNFAPKQKSQFFLFEVLPM
jgi:hypothetical protein